MLPKFFPKFVQQDTGILRQKSSSDWNAWHDLLADNPVECKDGEALTGFKLEASQNKHLGFFLKTRPLFDRPWKKEKSYFVWRQAFRTYDLYEKLGVQPPAVRGWVSQVSIRVQQNWRPWRLL